jgi:hypothetical protein
LIRIKWSPLLSVVIDQDELMETALTGRKFTWCKYHDYPTYELRDRVLVSPSREEHFPLVRVTTLSSDLSNHNPLLIKSRERPVVPTTFQF